MTIQRQILREAPAAMRQEEKISKELITRLQSKLAESKAEFADDNKNFARVGSHVDANRYLALALASLGNRSGVDELNILW